MTEKTVLQKIKKLAEENNFSYYRMGGGIYNTRGISDCYLVRNEDVNSMVHLNSLFVEVKVNNTIITELQKSFLNKEHLAVIFFVTFNKKENFISKEVKVNSFYNKMFHVAKLGHDSQFTKHFERLNDFVVKFSKLDFRIRR